MILTCCFEVFFISFIMFDNVKRYQFRFRQKIALSNLKRQIIRAHFVGIGHCDDVVHSTEKNPCNV